jgi:hypothetical protein
MISRNGYCLALTPVSAMREVSSGRLPAWLNPELEVVGAIDTMDADGRIDARETIREKAELQDGKSELSSSRAGAVSRRRRGPSRST